MNNLFMLFTAALLIQGTPAIADEYQLDPDHSEIGFSIRHLVINSVRGAFREYSGGFAVDAQNKLLSAQAEIKVASVDTRVAKRDEHLRSLDFFETAKYPAITFRSTAIVPGEGGSYAVTGLLKIKNVEKEVRLTGELSGPIKDPWGMQRMGITLRGTIDRNDFGVSYNATMESGGLLIDKSVAVYLEGEGIRKQ